MKIKLKDRLTCPSCSGDIFLRMLFQHLRFDKDDLSKHQVFKLSQIQEDYVVCAGCNNNYIIVNNELTVQDKKLVPNPEKKSNLIITSN